MPWCGCWVGALCLWCGDCKRGSHSCFAPLLPACGHAWALQLLVAPADCKKLYATYCASAGWYVCITEHHCYTMPLWGVAHTLSSKDMQETSPLHSLPAGESKWNPNRTVWKLHLLHHPQGPSLPHWSRTRGRNMWDTEKARYLSCSQRPQPTLSTVTLTTS